MKLTSDIVFKAPETMTLRYAMIYAERTPRWWWCKYLPMSWNWAWRGGPVAYVDLTADQQSEIPNGKP